MTAHTYRFLHTHTHPHARRDHKAICHLKYSVDRRRFVVGSSVASPAQKAEATAAHQHDSIGVTEAIAHEACAQTLRSSTTYYINYFRCRSENADAAKPAPTAIWINGDRSVTSTMPLECGCRLCAWTTTIIIIINSARIVSPPLGVTATAAARYSIVHDKCKDAGRIPPRAMHFDSTECVQNVVA